MVWVSGRDIARDTIQVMLSANYADTWRKLHPTGEGYTFPTWSPHVRLDYIFTPQRYASRLTECTVVKNAPDAAAASDHFPLFAVIADES
jgi:exodeoxyribonuclease-3